MASYATLQDAFGVDSFGAPVHDEMNGTEYFDQRPVVSDGRHQAREPLREPMAPHNVYSTREYMAQPAQGPHAQESHGSAVQESMQGPVLVRYNPHEPRRRTTAKRHDVEPYEQFAPTQLGGADLVAPLRALPPAQREIVTAGVVGAVVYMILSLLEA